MTSLDRGRYQINEDDDQRSRVYREYTYWSPLLGSYATRLSVPDDQGSEFFAIVERPISGHDWRMARAEALQTIEAAILRGDAPGEVEI